MSSRTPLSSDHSDAPCGEEQQQHNQTDVVRDQKQPTPEQEQEEEEGEDISPPRGVMFYLCAEDIAASQAELCLTEDPMHPFLHDFNDDSPPKSMQRELRRDIPPSATAAVDPREGSVEVSVECDFVLRPSSHQFRHTVRRATHNPTSTHDLDRRVNRARKRRERALAQRTLVTPDKRSQVEANEQERLDAAAERLHQKMERAAQLREEQLQARQRQHESAERIRSARLQMARQRRATALQEYTMTVHPVLSEFRKQGLVLSGGARTRAEVETVLQSDGLAACKHCNQSRPAVRSCPVTGRVHPRQLVHLSEEFLRHTGTLRRFLHQEKKVKCSENEKAKATGMPLVPSTSNFDGFATSPTSPVPRDPNASQRGFTKAAPASMFPSATAAATNTSTPATKPPVPVGLPHFLPLAFYQACDHRQHEESFTAKNVVLLMEEVFTAVEAVLRKAYPTVEELDDDYEEEEGGDVNDTNRENGSGTCCDDVQAACDHLRHTLNRFVRAWTQFANVMSLRTKEEAEPVAQTSSSSTKSAARPSEADGKSSSGNQREGAKHHARGKAELLEGMLKAYMQLAATQHWREVDIERRKELSERSQARRNREAIMGSKRAELTEAIAIQLRELHRSIVQLGGEAELSERMSKVDYASSATGGESGMDGDEGRQADTPATSPDIRSSKPRTRPASWSSTPPASGSDDGSSAMSDSASTCSSGSGTPSKRVHTTARSSAGFRAQLAADRLKMKQKRSAHASASTAHCRTRSATTAAPSFDSVPPPVKSSISRHIDPSATDGNDGDQDD